MRAQLAAIASAALVSGALSTSVLKTNGFSNCNNGSDSSITVNNVDLSFDPTTNIITFDVSGSSEKSQDVTATLIITAYGETVYTDTFDPCAASTKVDQLCPVPAGNFGASGNQTIPSSYASQIPSIAYTIPDLEGNAQMILKGKDGKEVACIESSVTNGKTVEVPAVSYVAAAIAAAALALSLASAAMGAGHPGASNSSPGFSEVMFWFQGMAMNGMHSVPYPTIYRSFTKNFAFSTGLIPWSGLQNSIDSFRSHTGGNLTQDSYQYLQNATLVFSDGSASGTTTDVARRGLLLLRDIVTNVNGSSSGNSTTSGSPKESHLVSGIQAYVEQLTIPQANTFMTVLLIFAIVVGTIIVGILLFKVILEVWALFGSFPKSLTTFRKEYWRVMFQTITNLILLLYGSWTLYCVFQITHGDSWAAKVLAGITLGIFTGLLAWYTFAIFRVAHKLKQTQGDSSALYENKETWKKYKLFYESYKKGYWWLFVPAIIYMFAKGCVLASADGHGLVQTAGQLIIESLMLALLLWSRPYNRKTGNWINIVIQVVRVASVCCILIFVEELGIAQSTKTITGVVLIAVQSALTVILAILIAVNSIIACCKENPHRRRRKALEKSKLADDQLTSLENDDAFMMQPKYGHTRQMSNGGSGSLKQDMAYESYRGRAVHDRFDSPEEDSDNPLVRNAASFGKLSDLAGQQKGRYRSVSRGSGGSISPPPIGRQMQPTLPTLDFGTRYQRVGS
jgi:hypothetical protein